MLGLLDRIYCRIRREEIKKAKIMLKKVKIESIFDTLTKSCWKYGIQYEVLIKNNEILEIRLKGRKEETLLKFQKCGMVFSEDYEKFLLKIEDMGIRKGIYITTGVFEGKLMKGRRRFFPFLNNVRIGDNYSFIKGQLGLFGSASEVFKHMEFKFYKFLPD